MWFRYPRPQLPSYERCTATGQRGYRCVLISDGHQDHAAVTADAIVRWFDGTTYRYPRQHIAWLGNQLWVSLGQ